MSSVSQIPIREQAKRIRQARAIRSDRRARGSEADGYTPELGQLIPPSSYEAWLRALWPGSFDGDLAPYHHDFWRWLWARSPTKSASSVHVWPRGFSKTTFARRAPIYLASIGYKYVVYIQETQNQANDSVQAIADMLERPHFARYYPDLAERRLGKFGTSKGWKRSRVWTRSGFIIDAVGLDKGVRGLNQDDQRPDVLIFDDIDSGKDSLKLTQKKLRTIQNTILPIGSSNRLILFLQNLISPHGIVTRLANANPEYQADFLTDRDVFGPYPAVTGLETEQRITSDGKRRYYITAGSSTWPSVKPIPTLEDELNELGLTPFIEEMQNEVRSYKGTLYEGYEFLTVPYPSLETFEDVQVWCDPAVTNTDGSDSNGIRAGGRRNDGVVVGLYSWEGRDSVNGTLRRALGVALELKASTLGIETNQGGDLWETAFDSVWKNMLEDLERTWRETQEPGELWPYRPPPKPTLVQAKASTATGGKRERWQIAKGARDRGEFVEALGTHELLFRCLRRLPEVKPYDLADGDAWLYVALTRPEPSEHNRPPTPAHMMAALKGALSGIKRR